MKKTAPKITLEELAEMVLNQTATLDTFVTMVASRFDRVDNRFKLYQDETNGNFKKVDENLQTIRQDLLRQGDRFVSEDKFEAHVARFNTLEEKFKAKIK